MPTVTVLRIENPAVLDYPPVEDLFRRVFDSGTNLPPFSEAVAAELRAIVSNPAHLVALGLEDGVPKALSIVLVSSSPLMLTPLVYLAYNEGGRATFRQMVSVTVQFVRDRGYSALYALNGLCHDSAYARLFRRVGVGRRVASMMRFELENEDGRKRK